MEDINKLVDKDVQKTAIKNYQKEKLVKNIVQNSSHKNNNKTNTSFSFNSNTDFFFDVDVTSEQTKENMIEKIKENGLKQEIKTIVTVQPDNNNVWQDDEKINANMVKEPYKKIQATSMYKNRKYKVVTAPTIKKGFKQKKWKKEALKAKSKNQKSVGDGSIDKDNEANTMLDTIDKVKDLKTEVPQTIKSIKDNTISVVTGTVKIVHQTGIDIKGAVSDAKVFAKKVNGLIERRQYSGVRQAKKRNTRNVYETNRTYQDKIRNTTQKAKNGSKKGNKDKKNNPSKEKDKKNHGLLQDIRRSAMRFATKPYAEQENNMSTGASDFAKRQAEKYAQSKLRKLAAKAGKTAFLYTGKFIVMLLKFAITVIVQIITFILSLAPLFLLPIFIIVVIVGLFSYFFGSADVDSTNTSYVAVKLNAKYDDFEDTIFKWGRNNKQGDSGYMVLYEGDCSDIENFNEVLNMYVVYSIEAEAIQSDYLLIDTDEENERLDKAFELFNSTYTTDDGKTLHVLKKTYEEVDSLLNDTQKDYYMLALEVSGIGAEEGYVIDKRIKKENSAKKALENSPQGTLPMSYDELKEIFTWMNENNVYPIDDGGVRYVTSQYTLARTDIDENHTTHYGVDFTSGKGIGANLVAIADATVYKMVSAQDDTTGYGNHVIVRFDDGTYALYAHMNDFIIKNGTNAEYDEDGYVIRPATNEEYLQEGNRLNAGDMIGHMGNTGDSFGAHLHLVLSTDAYGTGPGSRYDFNDYVACVWVNDFDYSYDY